MPEFIRSIVGLDRQAAQAKFNDALDGVVLSPRQIDFVSTIVDYLTASGSMDPAALYEPPFTDISPNGMADLFDRPNADRIVAAIRDFDPRLDAA